MNSELVAEGGYCAPHGNTGISFGMAALRMQHLLEGLPTFTAVRGDIDFSPPEVRWARRRERELRAQTRMWDWPTAPEVAR